LIIIPAFIITKGSIFPGYNALFVCLGAAILIYLGKNEEKTYLTKALGVKPVVFIGLISYSLYLWHWPVFAIFKAVGLEFSNLEMLSVILGLVLISFLSWKFIEQPFRYKFKWSFLTTFIVLFISPIVSFYGLKNIANQNSEFNDFRLSGNPYVESYIYQHPIRSDLCFSINYINNPDRENKCEIGNLEAKEPKVFYYGDSHAQANVSFVNYLLNDAGLKANNGFWGGGLFLKNINIDEASKRLKSQSRASIKSYVNYVNREINSKKYDYVITTGYYTSHFNRYPLEEISQKFLDTVDMIHQSGAKLIILKDTPVVGKMARDALYSSMFGNEKTVSIDFEDALKQKEIEEKMWNLVKEKYPQTIFVDLKGVICNDKKCNIKIKDILFYRDSNHITDYASKYLGQKYLEKYGNPLEVLVEQEVAKKAEK
ncbi:MAG TPA: hypothetical protein DCL21_05425, partial [Alphaproteobacteria bacterium]|nr:hypothetical protein [Alphaproteobacteria bacterium]